MVCDTLWRINFLFASLLYAILIFCFQMNCLFSLSPTFSNMYQHLHFLFLQAENAETGVGAEDGV